MWTRVVCQWWRNGTLKIGKYHSISTKIQCRFVAYVCILLRLPHVGRAVATVAIYRNFLRWLGVPQELMWCHFSHSHLHVCSCFDSGMFFFCCWMVVCFARNTSYILGVELCSCTAISRQTKVAHLLQRNKQKIDFTLKWNVIAVPPSRKWARRATYI